MAVTSDIAPWVTPADLEGEPRLDGKELPTGLTLADCCAMATDYLYRVTGKRFTTYEVTIRPQRVSESCGCGFGWVQTMADWGHWWLGASCGCGGGTELVLPEVAGAITEVKVNGTVLGSSFYTLFDDRRLVRTDGLPWPCCQDLSKPAGSVGTWSVKFLAGVAPPRSGFVAARELAIELARHLSSDKTSRLSARAVTIQRQGVTFQVSPVTDSRVGIPIVDMFIDSINHETVPFSVMSPDTIAARQ